VVLPLSEIARLRATVDDRWRSPVADAAVARWGRPPGSALFWRSSARHVFVVLDESGTRREAYLRLAPDRVLGREVIETVTAVNAALAAHGLDVVRPVPSVDGRFVESVDTAEGVFHAVLVTAAAGEQLDVDALTEARARAWGTALARFHRIGAAVLTGGVAADGLTALPDGLTRLRVTVPLLDGDPPVARAARVVLERAEAMPRDQGCYGLVHLDFELDNLTWSAETPVVFDLDEMERSWYAADLASAVRDLVPEPLALLDGPVPALDGVLAGYGEEGFAEPPDGPTLALFTAVNAIRSLARLLPVLAEEPVTLSVMNGEGDLRQVLEAYALRQRTIVLDLADRLG